MPEQTQVKHLTGAPFYGRLLALSIDIRVDWEKPARTNTLAYIEHLQITGCQFHKNFINVTNLKLKHFENTALHWIVQLILQGP